MLAVTIVSCEFPRVCVSVAFVRSPQDRDRLGQSFVQRCFAAVQVLFAFANIPFTFVIAHLSSVHPRRRGT